MALRHPRLLWFDSHRHVRVNRDAPSVINRIDSLATNGSEAVRGSDEESNGGGGDLLAWLKKEASADEKGGTTTAGGAVVAEALCSTGPLTDWAAIAATPSVSVVSMRQLPQGRTGGVAPLTPVMTETTAISLESPRQDVVPQPTSSSADTAVQGAGSGEHEQQAAVVAVTRLRIKGYGVHPWWACEALGRPRVAEKPREGGRRVVAVDECCVRALVTPTTASKKEGAAALPSAVEGGAVTHESLWDVTRLNADASATATCSPSHSLPSCGWWYDELEARLRHDPTAFVGEIGLDTLLCDVPLPFQIALFNRQLDLAAKYGRVASVHCVKCIQPLREVLLQRPLSRYPRAIVMHGFTGSLDAAKQLLSMKGGRGARMYIGVGLSTTGRLKHFGALLQSLPSDRLLVESDAYDDRSAADLVHGAVHAASSFSLPSPASPPLAGGSMTVVSHVDDVSDERRSGQSVGCGEAEEGAFVSSSSVHLFQSGNAIRLWLPAY